MNYFIDGADFVADAEEDSVRGAVDGVARHFWRRGIAALVVAVEDSVGVILAAIVDGGVVVGVVVVFLVAAGADPSCERHVASGHEECGPVRSRFLTTGRRTSHGQRLRIARIVGGLSAQRLHQELRQLGRVPTGDSGL